MAGPNESDLETWGKSAYDFSNSECAWCHPGGGPMEYDRAGYRYDGRIGGYRPDTGLDGAGVEFNPNRNTFYGDYFVFDYETGALVSKAGQNGTCVSNACSTGPFVGEYCRDNSDCRDGWQYKGSSEIDCLSCHYGRQYNNFVRNYCLSSEGGNKGPQYGPSFGLVGTGFITDFDDNGVPIFESFMVNTSKRGDAGPDGGNPTCNLVSYKYNGILDGDFIVGTPRKENCATCHKADLSWKDGICRETKTTCSSDFECGDPSLSFFDNFCDTDLNPSYRYNTGPAGWPLGATAFQKYIPADPGATECTTDSDCPYSVSPDNQSFCDSDTGKCNATPYYLKKGRAEYGKRAESINDRMNAEHHMSPRVGFVCIDCHYMLGEDRNLDTYEYTATDFGPVLDRQGREVLPPVSVYKIDHQFAKGNNFPDGKNMDQFDRTVICERCHMYYGTPDQHPNVVEKGTCADSGAPCTMDFVIGCTPDGNGNPVECIASGTYAVNLEFGPDLVAETADDYRDLPMPRHGAYPSLHFNKIDCRTCHITEQNFLSKEVIADYSSTPYPMDGGVDIPRPQELSGGTYRCVGGSEEGERCNTLGFTATCEGGACEWVDYVCVGGGIDADDADGDGNTTELIENRRCPGTRTDDPLCQGKDVAGLPVAGACVKDGIHYRPLIAWVCKDKADCRAGEMELAPVTTMVDFIWKDLDTDLPYAQRFATEAAKIFRETQGGMGEPGDPFTWTLNTPQGGDIGIIVNTAAEVSGMAGVLKGTVGSLPNALRIPNPALNLYLNTFTTSHNRSLEETIGLKGCIECHSSSDPENENYSPLSVGFFDGHYTLFEQPADGGGLQMACDGGDCTNGTCGDADTCVGGAKNGVVCAGDADCAANKRVAASLEFKCNTVASSSKIIDLTEGKANGEVIDNVINRGDVLCYSGAFISGHLLERQSSAYTTNFRPSFTAVQSGTVSLQVDFDGAKSVCGYYKCEDTDDDNLGDTCMGGVNTGNPCNDDYHECEGTCVYSWDFNNDGIYEDKYVEDGECLWQIGRCDKKGLRPELSCDDDSDCVGRNHEQVSFAYPDTQYYTAKLEVMDPDTGFSRAALKVVKAKVIADPLGPQVTGADTGDKQVTITINEDLPATNPDPAGRQMRSAYIDWRDRSTDSLRISTGVTSATKAHTYATAGTYYPRVRVTEADGNQYYYQVKVTVD